MEALKRYDELKYNNISETNYNGEEVEECHVQEWLTAINKWVPDFSNFPNNF